jgi:hypothetical protein
MQTLGKAENEGNKWITTRKKQSPARLHLILAKSLATCAVRLCRPLQVQPMELPVGRLGEGDPLLMNAPVFQSFRGVQRSWSPRAPTRRDRHNGDVL